MGRRMTLVLSVIIVVFLGALVIGCTTPTATPAPTTKPTVTATATVTATPGQVMEIKYHLPGSPTSTAHVYVYTGWIKALEEQSNGRFKITVYTGGALGKAVDQADLLMKGGADMGSFNSGFTPGRFPLSGVIELPLMTPNIEVAIYTIQKLYDKYPQFAAEYPGLKILTIDTTDPIITCFPKKALRVLEDFKGMTIRANSDQGSKLLTAFGASPMFSDTTEIYTLLERGTIDGTMVTLEGVKSFKLAELIKFANLTGLSCAQTVFAMNPTTFSKLPADIQTLITTGALGKDYLTKQRIAGYNINTAEGIAGLQGNKAEFIRISADEFARWKTAATPLYDVWIKERTAAGQPAQAIFNDMVAFEAELLKTYPVKTY